MILDACFLIDLLAEDSAAVAKLDEIQDELLAVPTLTYTEVGVGFDPESEKRQRFQEIISGEPGVEIIAPEVDAWRDGLRNMLDAPAHTPNRDAVPTWGDYVDEKYEVFVDNGFL